MDTKNTIPIRRTQERVLPSEITDLIELLCFVAMNEPLNQHANDQQDAQEIL